MADNVHWLRDTYGPALRAYYADLLKQPVPQKIIDLLSGLETESGAAEGARDAHNPTAAPQCEPQPDASE